MYCQYAPLIEIHSVDKEILAFSTEGEVTLAIESNLLVGSKEYIIDQLVRSRLMRSKVVTAASRARKFSCNAILQQIHGSQYSADYRFFPSNAVQKTPLLKFC